MLELCVNVLCSDTAARVCMNSRICGKQRFSFEQSCFARLCICCFARLCVSLFIGGSGAIWLACLACRLAKTIRRRTNLCGTSESGTWSFVPCDKGVKNDKGMDRQALLACEVLVPNTKRSNTHVCRRTFNGGATQKPLAWDICLRTEQ
jgi:hypothetical protein